jgi:hypothetical protein
MRFRICLNDFIAFAGHRYAMISMKIILLKLLQRYKFSTDLSYDDLRFKAVLTLKLVGDHLVSIANRY